MTVLVQVNTRKKIGEPDYLKVFTNCDAANARLAENDPEGVASEAVFWNEGDESDGVPTSFSRGAAPLWSWSFARSVQ
jgi:hypothetical protein